MQLTKYIVLCGCCHLVTCLVLTKASNTTHRQVHRQKIASVLQGLLTSFRICFEQYKTKYMNKACFIWLHEFFWSKNIKKWAWLQQNRHISIKNWYDIGFYLIYPLNISKKIFLSKSRKNDPSRFQLITNSKIFLCIYEVFSIAPRFCLYCIIERRAPIS